MRDLNQLYKKANWIWHQRWRNGVKYNLQLYERVGDLNFNPKVEKKHRFMMHDLQMSGYVFLLN